MEWMNGKRDGVEGVMIERYGGRTDGHGDRVGVLDMFTLPEAGLHDLPLQAAYLCVS
jgi:hypothetical protein